MANKAQNLEELQKAWGRKLLGAAALATTMAGSQMQAPSDNLSVEQHAPKFDVKKLKTPKLDIPGIQAAMAMTESNNGKNTNHELLTRGPDAGTRAKGHYGWTNSSLKETIARSPTYSKTHAHVLNYDDDQMHDLIYNKEPDLQHKLAAERIADIAKRLKTNKPEHVYFAWLNGIGGTQKAIKEGADIENHWHVRRNLENYDKIKSKQLQRSFQEFFLENLCKNQLNSKISKDTLESTKILSDSWKKARKKLQEDNCDELTKPQGIPEWKKDQEEMKNSHSDQLVSLIKSQSI